ncbi:acyl-CoA synthetase family member 2, mitochondrial-like protein [Lates japonicus]|uniref:Medium-chain acyl-CoA ligase ACSF2, mitochondrial n=1 Tax=Lates japonicus TaxID=270547 RepID=A0AAD3R9N6_LATJO|nr:acyl-CoA synthetase family member 2, mitochondrial-like protein [Lates japonicus]
MRIRAQEEERLGRTSGRGRAKVWRLTRETHYVDDRHEDDEGAVSTETREITQGARATSVHNEERSSILRGRHDGPKQVKLSHYPQHSFWMFGKHMKHDTSVSAGLINWKQALDLFREHEKNLPIEQTRIPGTASTLVLLMMTISAGRRGELQLHTMISNIAFCSQTLRNNCGFARSLKVLQRPWTCQPGLSAASRGIHVDSPPIIPTLTTSYAHGTSSTSLLHTTVGESLLRAVERWPDREAMAFLQDGVRKTFAQFQKDVDQAAAGLLALGLNKGDRLGMWGPNTYEWVLFQFATARAGIILVSVNPAYQLQEVEFALRKVGCKAIVCPTQFKTQKYCDMLRQICPEIESSSPGDIKSARLPDLRSVIVLDSRHPGMLHLDDVMQAGTSQYVQQLQDLQKGITGAPKGATLSHHYIVNNAYFIGRRVGYNWRPNPRICLPVPLYHCFGSVGGGMCMAMHGISLVFPSPGYDGKANLAALESERCTFVYGTPTMYVDMINQPDLAKYDLSTVEAGIMAGSPCPPELVKKVVSLMGIKEITPVTRTGSSSAPPVEKTQYQQPNQTVCPPTRDPMTWTRCTGPQGQHGKVQTGTERRTESSVVRKREEKNKIMQSQPRATPKPP